MRYPIGFISAALAAAAMMVGPVTFDDRRYSDEPRPARRRPTSIYGKPEDLLPRRSKRRSRRLAAKKS